MHRFLICYVDGWQQYSQLNITPEGLLHSSYVGNILDFGSYSSPFISWRILKSSQYPPGNFLFSDLIFLQIFINNIMMFPDRLHSLLDIIFYQAVIDSPVAVQQPVPVFLSNIESIVVDHRFKQLGKRFV